MDMRVRSRDVTLVATSQVRFECLEEGVDALDVVGVMWLGLRGLATVLLRLVSPAVGRDTARGGYGPEREGR